VMATRRDSRWRCHRQVLIVVLLTFVLLAAGCSVTPDSSSPGITLQVTTPQSRGQIVSGLQILLLLTVLALAPAILIVTTAFVRIVIVFSVLRNAIGTPQLPPNQVVIGLALFLTFFVMAPVWDTVNTDAVQPYLAGEIDQDMALSRGIAPLREFMLEQVRTDDLSLFVSLAQLPRPHSADDVPTYVLVPAFLISELKTAFQMAFVIYIPFLIIDMVVSSALMSMGMMMLPPTMISLPFKLLLFVMVDGWHLLARSLVVSFS